MGWELVFINKTVYIYFKKREEKNIHTIIKRDYIIIIGHMYITQPISRLIGASYNG